MKDIKGKEVRICLDHWENTQLSTIEGKQLRQKRHITSGLYSPSHIILFSHDKLWVSSALRVEGFRFLHTQIRAPQIPRSDCSDR